MAGRTLSILVLAFAFAVVAAASASDRRTVADVASGRPFVVYDTIGEAGGVPDITSVAVARDRKDRLTFAVNVAAHPAMKRGDLFTIGIDADRKLATGTDGRDVVMMLGWFAKDPGPTYGLGSWDGSSWQQLDVVADVSYPESGPRFSVSMDDIGVGRSFRFDARAERLTAHARNAVDRAPARGVARVSLAVPARVSQIGRMTIPFPTLLPKAGKLLRARGFEISVDEQEIVPGISGGGVVKPDRLRCTAKIGRATLPPVGSCAWKIPSTARGRTLMLKVSVAYGGDEITQVYPLSVE